MEATQQETQTANTKTKSSQKKPTQSSVTIDEVLDVIKEGSMPVVGAFLHQASQMAGTALVEKSLNQIRLPTAVFSWLKNGDLLIEFKDKKGNIRANVIPGPSVASLELDLKKISETMRQ